MVFTLLDWCYLTVLASIYGMGGMAVFHRWLGWLPPAYCLPLELLWGLALMTVLGGYLSLILPLGVIAYILMGLGAIALAIHQRHVLRDRWQRHWGDWQRIPPWLKVFIFFIIFLLIYQASVGPFHYDTGLYHAQAVAWINTYPVVPGLGNFHSRFAFNSHFFITAALGNFSFWMKEPFHNINGYILGLALLWSIAPWTALWCREKVAIAEVYQALSFIPFSYLIFDDLRQSVDVASLPSDLSAAVWIMITIALGIAYFSHPPDRQDLILAIGLGTVAAITTKISALPLGLVPLICLIQRAILNRRQENLSKEGTKILVKLMALGGFFMAPFFLRNIFLSGYLIYPFQGLNLLSVDWKMPVAMIEAERQSIKNWSIVPGQDAGPVVVQGLAVWANLWWRIFRHHPLVQAVILCTAIAPIYGLLTLRQQGGKWWQYWPLPLVLGLGIVFWFLAAPDLRFGYGFLAAWGVWAITPAIAHMIRHTQKFPTSYRAGSYGYALLCALFFLSRCHFFLGDQAYLWQPMTYPQVTTRALPVFGITLYQPLETDQCWLAAFPCTPSLPNGFAFRGNNLRQGFRIYLPENRKSLS